jgi:uncharacterized membrane protein
LSSRSFILLAMILGLLALSPASSAFSSGSLVLTVYSDGYVVVAQSFSVDPKASSIQVPLLSPAISDLVATDQNGAPLSYGFSQSSSNITVYSLGATEVNLRYVTGSLTSKNGTVWTFAFDAKYNSTVELPQFSSLVAVSGAPYSINETNQTPEMRLSAGTWRISYGVSIQTTSTTSTNVSTGSQSSNSGGVQPGGVGGLTAAEVDIGVLLVAAFAALGFYFLWWRRRGIGRIGEDLRPDDVQVLNFIQEKGGKVLEPEIRMRFALPKTSAWRQIKRLERLGYVKVTKIGSQNQIELLKEKSPGA